MRKINKIIVHCSDSSFGDAKDIDQWHKERGWSGIGYHYVILNGARDKGIFDPSVDGYIEVGRPLEKSGAHCAGQNRDSIGICMIGKTEFTDNQFIGLEALLRGLKAQFNLTNDDIYGHYNFSSKTCPNFDVEKFKEEKLND